MNTKIICITGCSSGIGAAMAQEFHARGAIVYATARRVSSLQALNDQGIRTLCMDVTDDDSIAAALTVIADAHGKLDLLINNAGFSQVGALVDLSREDLRAQYETNVISPMLVTKAAVTLLRAGSAQSQGHSIVANVGSIVGLVATPFAGAYCSSKAAIHSLTDTLRMELAPFGIHLVTIQPGGVISSFGEHAEAAIRLPSTSLYHAAAEGIHARAVAGQQGATPAAEFVRPIVDALMKTQPPILLRGGKNSFKLPLFKRLLPTKWLDKKLSSLYGLNQLGGSSD